MVVLPVSLGRPVGNHGVMGAINQLLFSSMFVVAGLHIVKLERTPGRVVAALVLFAWGAAFALLLLAGGE